MSSEHDNLEFKEPKYDTTLWATSLVGLFSIVLAIFVLLFSITSVNQIKTAKAMGGVQGKFAQPSITENKDAVSDPQFAATQTPASGAQNSLRLYYAPLRKVAQDILELDETSIIEKGDVMIFRLPTNMLFKAGTTEMEDRKLFIEKLADQLTSAAFNLHIDVECVMGYANDAEAALAIARAGAFARKMVDSGVTENSIYVGVNQDDPNFINITFSPRDETRASLVF